MKTWAGLSNGSAEPSASPNGCAPQDPAERQDMHNSPSGMAPLCWAVSVQARDSPHLTERNFGHHAPTRLATTLVSTLKTLTNTFSTRNTSAHEFSHPQLITRSARGSTQRRTLPATGGRSHSP